MGISFWAARVILSYSLNTGILPAFIDISCTEHNGHLNMWFAEFLPCERAMLGSHWKIKRVCNIKGERLTFNMKFYFPAQVLRVFRIASYMKDNLVNISNGDRVNYSYIPTLNDFQTKSMPCFVKIKQVENLAYYFTNNMG